MQRRLFRGYSLYGGVLRLWLLACLLAAGFLTFKILNQQQLMEQVPQNPPTNQQMEIKNQSTEEKQLKVAPGVNPSFPSNLVLSFYYVWYGNPKFNGEWMHWNHGVLVDNGGYFTPQTDSIGANFYPQLGLYSSIDPDIIEAHMKMFYESRIGVLCTSWWGSVADGQLLHQKGYTDQMVSLFLDTAQKWSIKICFHHEPYKGRSPSSVRKDIEYIIDTYGDHPAFFKLNNKPVFFVYDSYLTSHEGWSSLLSPYKDSELSIRGTKYDSIMIALYVNSQDQSLVEKGHFDGFYTYFATNGFTIGSTTNNWPNIAAWCAKRGKIFIPSVGPGYDDTRIRPWNAQNKRSRQQGGYYDTMWEAALGIQQNYYETVKMVSITSFNEWHEGTQIEPAISKSIRYSRPVQNPANVNVDELEESPYNYENYDPRDPNYYLERSKYWIDKFDPLTS